jgi:hypothetical protein
MPHLRPALRPLRSLLPAALAFAVLSACSGQGEGELCNTNAGNQGSDDCQSGLACVVNPTADMNACGANAITPCKSLGRCCPPDPSQATTAVCSSNSGGLDASPAPPDATSEETPSAEASADAPAESTAEAEAPGDGSDGGTE